MARRIQNAETSPSADEKPDDPAEQNAAAYSIGLNLYRYPSEAEGEDAALIERFETTPSTDKALYPICMKCTYLVRNRQRLTGDARQRTKEAIEPLIAPLFKGDGPEDETGKKKLYQLLVAAKKANVIEVIIPYVKEDEGWAARLFPWETILRLAAMQTQADDLFVTRVLHKSKDAQLPETTATLAGTRAFSPKGLLQITSAPGVLGDYYDFQEEADAIARALTPDGGAPEKLVNPTAGRIKDAVDEHSPSIIAIAAIDVAYAQASFDVLPGGGDVAVSNNGRSQTTKEGKRIFPDGFIVSSQASTTDYDTINHLELHDLIAAARTKPEMVCLAMSQSAGRLAPLAVAGGAISAIGFEGDVYDHVIAFYLQTFFKNWRGGGWRLIDAALAAHKAQQKFPEAERCNPVFYCGQSMVPTQGHAARSFAQDGSAAKDKKAGRKHKTEHPADSDEPIAFDPDRHLQLSWELEPAASYCLLHNKRPVFKNLSIRKASGTGPAPAVEVRAELVANGARSSWRGAVDLNSKSAKKLTIDDIRFSLGAREFRQIQESTQASITLSLICQGVPRIVDTKTFTLLPPDQWHDNPAQWQWLASFIQPRDPAVLKVISRADGYLKTLMDDAFAAFDGYQNVDIDPDRTDTQARAIWSAITYDLGLRYTNPPPVYMYDRPAGHAGGSAGHRSEFDGPNQRVRVPSQILAESRATCIDLSLLFAACLEYIGIYPVLVLTVGHAFPGWWRSPGAFDDFKNMMDLSDVPVAGSGNQPDQPEGPARRREKSPAISEALDYGRVVQAIAKGGLALIESTEMCGAGRFQDALIIGQRHLTDPAVFDALLDIERARSMSPPITPLPLLLGE